MGVSEWSNLQYPPPPPIPGKGYNPGKGYGAATQSVNDKLADVLDRSLNKEAKGFEDDLQRVTPNRGGLLKRWGPFERGIYSKFQKMVRPLSTRKLIKIDLTYLDLKLASNSDSNQF